MLCTNILGVFRILTTNLKYVISILHYKVSTTCLYLRQFYFDFQFFLFSSCTWQRTQSFSVTTINYFRLSFLQAKRVILNNFNQNGRCPTILLQFSNTKFHKNPFGGSRALTYRQTDRQTDWLTFGRIFQGHGRLSHLSLKCVWRNSPKWVVGYNMQFWSGSVRNMTVGF